MLFNEPKLLKYGLPYEHLIAQTGFSALQRAEIAEILMVLTERDLADCVSVLFNEPKLLK